MSFQMFNNKNNKEIVVNKIFLGEFSEREVKIFFFLILIYYRVYFIFLFLFMSEPKS